MADIIDKANELTDLFIEESLKQQEASKRKVPVYVEGVEVECEECGDILSEFRAKNYGICVDCQEQIEQQEKKKKLLEEEIFYQKRMRREASLKGVSFGKQFNFGGRYGQYNGRP